MEVTDVELVAKRRLGLVQAINPHHPSTSREPIAQRSLGAFGVPHFAVGNELFWGDDKLEDNELFWGDDKLEDAILWALSKARLTSDGPIAPVTEPRERACRQAQRM